MKTNVTKTLTNFNKNSSSLRQWRLMSLKRWRTLIIIHQAYRQWRLMSLKRWRTLIIIHQAYNNED